MAVDNQPEISFLIPQGTLARQPISVVFICRTVAGRTRLVAQPGGPMLGFALHLGIFISPRRFPADICL